MDKLLESLISKAKLECEEAHRQLLFAFNGLYMISLRRRGGLMVSVLNPRLDVPCSSPGWGQDTFHPGRSSNTPSYFMLRKLELSTCPMGRLGLYKG